MYVPLSSARRRRVVGRMQAAWDPPTRSATRRPSSSRSPSPPAGRRTSRWTAHTRPSDGPVAQQRADEPVDVVRPIEPAGTAPSAGRGRGTGLRSTNGESPSAASSRTAAGRASRRLAVIDRRLIGRRSSRQPASRLDERLPRRRTRAASRIEKSSTPRRRTFGAISRLFRQVSVRNVGDSSATRRIVIGAVREPQPRPGSTPRTAHAQSACDDRRTTGMP